MALRPMVGVQADRIEDQIALGLRQHPTCRVVIVQPVEGHQGHCATFDGFSRGRHRDLPDVIAASIVVLDRIADDLFEKCGGQRVKVVQQIQLSPVPHRSVVHFDECLGRKLSLGDFQRSTPAGL